MLRCPRCCRAGESQEEIQERCPDKGIMGCPDPLEVTPGRDVVLLCRREMCGKIFSFPAKLIPGRGIPAEVSCMFSPCEIMVVAPAALVNPSLSLNPPKKAGRGKAEG